MTSPWDRTLPVALICAGLGAEVALGERAYLRPDVRSRWFADELSIEPVLDYSLGIGFRF